MDIKVYSVSEDTATGSVDFCALLDEVEADPVVPSPQSITIDGDTLSFAFTVTLLSPEVLALNALVAAHPQSVCQPSDAGSTSYQYSADPAVTDDTSRGIQVGDKWINTVTGSIFICLGNGIGVANWEKQLGAVPYSWLFPNQASREAATGFIADDVGKLARQEDNNSLWMLTDYTPITWRDTASPTSSLDFSNILFTYAGEFVIVLGTSNKGELVTV